MQPPKVLCLALLVVFASPNVSLSAEPPAAAGQENPLPESSDSSIGYPTAEAAMQALRAKPGVKFTTQNGWIVATDDSEPAVWLFLQPDNPAYPAVVKRHVVSDAKGSSIETQIHCDASKAACDRLVRELLGPNPAIQ